MLFVFLSRPSCLDLTYPECVERICANLKTALHNPIKELPKRALPTRRLRGIHIRQISRHPLRIRLIIQYQRRDRIKLERLPQHTPTGHCTLLLVIPIAQCYDDLGSRLQDVVQGYGFGGWRAGGFVPEGV